MDSGGISPLVLDGSEENGYGIYIYIYIYMYSIQHGDFKISNQSCETMGRLAAVGSKASLSSLG